MKAVSLLGSDESLNWKQEADGLVITCPNEMPFRIAVGFKIGLAQAAAGQAGAKASLSN